MASSHGANHRPSVAHAGQIVCDQSRIGFSAKARVPSHLHMTEHVSSSTSYSVGKLTMARSMRLNLATGVEVQCSQPSGPHGVQMRPWI